MTDFNKPAVDRLEGEAAGALSEIYLRGGVQEIHHGPDGAGPDIGRLLKQFLKKFPPHPNIKSKGPM